MDDSSNPLPAAPAASEPAGSLTLLRRYAPAALAFLAGMAVTVGWVLAARLAVRHERQLQFDHVAGRYVEALSASLEAVADAPHAVAALYQASVSVEREEFREFTVPLLARNPSLRALEWVPRISRAEVPGLVQKARRDGITGYGVFDLDTGGPRPPADSRAEYFPVFYAEPTDMNRQALGLDLASEPARHAALEAARDGGALRITGRIRIVQDLDGKHGDGFLAILPVYRNDVSVATLDDRRRNLTGFVVAVFQAANLFGGLVLDPAEKDGVRVALTDESASGADRRILDLASAGEPAGAPEVSRLGEGFRREETIQVGGRYWRLVVEAVPGGIFYRQGLAPTGILATGTLAAILLSFYLAALTRRTADLRESEAKARVLVEAAPEAIVVLDPRRGRFVDANQNAERLFGISRERLLARGPVELSPMRQPDGRLSAEAAEGYVREALAGHPQRLEWVHWDAQGREFPCEVNLVRLPSPGGPLVRGSLVDVTERKRAETERREFEEKMRHSQRLESLGLLTGGIAHDFNNLLTPILGYASLARKDVPDGSPVGEALARIETTARRASELIRQLLAYTGKSAIAASYISVNSLVLEMGHLLRVSIPKSISIEFALSDDVPEIIADAAQIRQVVLNLITNAADSIGEGPGWIILSTGVARLETAELAQLTGPTGLPAGQYAWVEVADTGTGMDRETLSRIFDPFFTTKEHGRGLGLAAILGIVRAHRGGLQVDSQPGRGTHFRVYFPREEAQAYSSVSDPAAPYAVKYRGKALVADDEDLIRQLARSLLESMGFQVREARDGVEALDAFLETPGDYAFLAFDVLMPALNGRAVLERIDRVRPGVPCLLMSGYDVRDASQPFAGRPASSFLQKPFTAAEFEAKVRESLAGVAPAGAEGRA